MFAKEKHRKMKDLKKFKESWWLIYLLFKQMIFTEKS